MRGISSYIERVNSQFDKCPAMPKGSKRIIPFINCAMARYFKHMNAEEYCYYYTRLGNPGCWHRYLDKNRSWHMWKLNTPEANARLMDKAGCLERYSKYVKRAWIVPKQSDCEAFVEFARKYEKYIVKPRASGGGEGVYMSRYVSDDIARSEYQTLVKEDSIVEQVILQHDALNALYPDSVNTIRIASVLTKEGPILLSSCMRIGNGGVIDNFCQGGMTAQVDFNTGRIETDAVDRERNVYDKHPITGVKFIGYQLPNWDYLKKAVCEMALMDPDAGFIGWDIAITPDGIEMVEANNNQGFGWQYALGTDWRKAYREANRKAWEYFHEKHPEAHVR